MLPIALCFAEASSRFDDHGGPYLYARAAFGADAGFAIGWMCWVTEVVSLAAVADGVGLALAPLSPWCASPAGFRLIAALAIAAMAAVNAAGVRWGARTSNLLTALKLAPLAAFALAGLPRLGALRASAFAPHGLRPMGAACFLAYFAFSGFEVVPVPAGEVADARRRVPWAVVASLAAAAALYVLVQAAAVACDPGLSSAASPLAHAAGVLWGPRGARVMAGAAAVSMLGFTAGCALGGPRYLVALARHGDLPAAAGASHPRWNTPAAAIAVTAALALAGAVLLDFERLVDVANVAVCAQYAATCLSVPVLRRSGGPAGFRLPGGLLLPASGAAATLWLGFQAEGAQLGAGLAILAAGFVLRAAVAAHG